MRCVSRGIRLALRRMPLSLHMVSELRFGSQGMFGLIQPIFFLSFHVISAYKPQSGLTSSFKLPTAKHRLSRSLLMLTWLWTLPSLVDAADRRKLLLLNLLILLQTSEIVRLKTMQIKNRLVCAAKNCFWEFFTMLGIKIIPSIYCWWDVMVGVIFSMRNCIY